MFNDALSHSTRLIKKKKDNKIHSFLCCVPSLPEGTTKVSIASTCITLSYMCQSQVVSISLPIYLWHHVLHKLLTSETRLHRHHQRHVNLVGPRRQLLHSGAWFNAYSNLKEADRENNRHGVYQSGWVTQWPSSCGSSSSVLSSEKPRQHRPHQHAALSDLLDEAAGVFRGLQVECVLVGSCCRHGLHPALRLRHHHMHVCGVDSCHTVVVLKQRILV